MPSLIEHLVTECDLARDGPPSYLGWGRPGQGSVAWLREVCAADRTKLRGDDDLGLLEKCLNSLDFVPCALTV